MLGFGDEHLVHNRPFYRIWNDGLIALVHVFGEIDDPRAREWTTAVHDLCLGLRAPRFIVVHLSDVESKTTLSERMHTAQVARQVLQKADYLLVFTGENLTASFLAQVVMRAAGVINFGFVSKEEELHAALARMRLGLIPLSGSNRKLA